MKRINWKVLAVATFILALALGFWYLSTVMTIEIMTFSLIKGTRDYNLMMWMAILLESSKELFTAKAILDRRINGIIRVIMLVIAVILLFASMIANIGQFLIYIQT